MYKFVTVFLNINEMKTYVFFLIRRVRCRSIQMITLIEFKKDTNKIEFLRNFHRRFLEFLQHCNNISINVVRCII